MPVRILDFMGLSIAKISATHGACCEAPECHRSCGDGFLSLGPRTENTGSFRTKLRGPARSASQHAPCVAERSAGNFYLCKQKDPLPGLFASPNVVLPWIATVIGL
jgi:hypothetical protein